MEEHFKRVRNYLILSEGAYASGMYPEAARFLDAAAEACIQGGNQVVALHHPGPEREDD